MKSSIFITGATGGFGRMVCVECAQRGFDLFLSDTEEEKLLHFAQCLARIYNVNVDFYPCDMSDFSSRTALIEYLNSSPYRFHMIINIAGIDPEGLFLKTSRETITRVMNINIVAPLDMIRSLTPLRDETKPLRILNVCSMAGFFPMPLRSIYAASKRALIDMSRALRSELKTLDATVTALCPAGMATNELLVKNMSVQGIFGRLTTLQLSTIASNALNRTLKGKAMYIPGIFNRFVLALSRLAPTSLISAYIYNRWEKVNKAYLDKFNEPGLMGKM